MSASETQGTATAPRSFLRAPLPHMRPASRRWALRLVMGLCGPLVQLRHADRLTAGDQPTLFAFNHNNSFESVVVPSALIWRRQGRIIHFLVDWMFLRIPVVGWILRQVEPVPVYTKPARFRLWESHRRARRNRDPLDACLRLLETGESVGIFPEGTRNPDPSRLLRGRRGLGYLVLRSKVPVQPVGIEFPARHRLGRMPKLGRMIVTIGPPLDFSWERELYRRLPSPQQGGREAVRAAQEMATAVVHRVMRSLAPLCAKAFDEPRPALPSASRAPLEETQPWQATR